MPWEGMLPSCQSSHTRSQAALQAFPSTPQFAHSCVTNSKHSGHPSSPNLHTEVTKGSMQQYQIALNFLRRLSCSGGMASIRVRGSTHHLTTEYRIPASPKMTSSSASHSGSGPCLLPGLLATAAAFTGFFTGASCGTQFTTPVCSNPCR